MTIGTMLRLVMFCSVIMAAGCGDALRIEKATDNAIVGPAGSDLPSVFAQS
jgi:hypothetical protein